MKLLISGSRDASSDMLQKAINVVAKTRIDGFYSQIIVGDAQGIDKQVIEACLVYDTPFHCYGISEFGRLPELTKGHYTQAVTGKYTKRSYLERDEIMVHEADAGIFIWDGKSRGTKYTHDYMKKLGKPVKLFDFSLEEDS